MSLKRISVIIPVYNVENDLDRCFCSVINQDYEDLEVILVDDGSTDSSGAMCDKYQEQYPNIKVIHQKNGGLSAARNTGLRYATGDYVSFVDSDDYLEENAYIELARYIEENSCDMCLFGHYRETDNQKIAYDVVPDKLIYSNKEEILGEFLSGVLNGRNSGKGECFTGLSVWCGLYSRTLLEEHEITFVSEKEILSEDIVFNMQAYIHSEKIAIYPKYLYHYVLRGQSLTQKYREDRFEAAVRLDSTLREVAQKNHLSELLAPAIQNCFFMNLIVCLKQEVIYEKINSHKKAMENLKIIGNNPRTEMYLETFKPQGMKRKIMTNALKHKRWSLLYWGIKAWITADGFTTKKR